MMRKSNQGFTLIELMVVIVIIGVLASLAIPRFTEASSKAKIAEAPRVIASYESALLALLAETGRGPTSTTGGGLIFEIPGDSKWFNYGITAQPYDDSDPDDVVKEDLSENKIAAQAKSQMGTFRSKDQLISQYNPGKPADAEGKNGENDCFFHTGGQGGEPDANGNITPASAENTSVVTVITKMVPNFMNACKKPS